jgi:hypothetical protein
MASVSSSSQRYWLLANIFPAGSSAHAAAASLSVQKTSAIPAEVATCASIN